MADKSSWCADTLAYRCSDARKPGFDSSRNAASECVAQEERTKKTRLKTLKSRAGFFVHGRDSHVYQACMSSRVTLHTVRPRDAHRPVGIQPVPLKEAVRAVRV